MMNIAIVYNPACFKRRTQMLDDVLLSIIDDSLELVEGDVYVKCKLGSVTYNF
jgi:hypothetical protein